MTFAKNALVVLLAVGVPLGTVVTAGSVAAQAQQTQASEQSRDARQMAHRGGERQGRGGMVRGARMLQMLEQFDTNGDRALTQEEVIEARAAQLTEFDADGDGALSLAEYEALWLDAMRERMVDRFQSHDDDGTGTITLEEFQEDVARLVERGDRNGDGVLNRDDFMRRGERGANQGER
ncbi:MAG: hypothetical protein AAFR93_15270 [Pseudomonadota bacterium]